MFSYITKRLFLMIPTLVGITLITFFIMKLAPGDPVSLKLLFMGEGISPQAMASALTDKTEPLPLPAWYLTAASSMSRAIHGKTEDTATFKTFKWAGKNSLFYLKWLNNLVHFNFGYSNKDKRPVIDKILEALPITLTLNILSILIVYTISIPLGIWSAMKQGSLIDKVVMIKLFILYSLPSFWVGTILLVYLASGDHLNIFPLTGYISDGAESLPFFPWLANVAWHLVLPVTAYVYGGFAFLSRFSRTNFLEVIRQDYIRTARAKGLPQRTVLWKHAFRNSLIPLVSLMGTLLPALLGGSVIIEQIFSIPGMGMLSFESVLSRDENVIMGITTIGAFLTLLSLLISDLLYVVVDPRISFEGK